jgi:hypothetical protein
MKAELGSSASTPAGVVDSYAEFLDDWGDRSRTC